MSSTLQISKTWNDQPTSHLYDIKFSISPSTGDMVVNINAPYHNNPRPPTSGRGRFPGLHNYEVVEIFISSYPDNYSNCNPYLEIQVNPHGQYMIVYFINEGGCRSIMLLCCHNFSSTLFILSNLLHILHFRRLRHSRLFYRT